MSKKELVEERRVENRASELPWVHLSRMALRDLPTDILYPFIPSSDQLILTLLFAILGAVNSWFCSI